MITIIHGEDSLSSYRRLSELIEKCKVRDIEIVVKDATELDQVTLRQETGPTDLFGKSKCLVIKGLLGGTKSKNKEAMIDSLQKIENAEIIIYESKKITPTALKPFAKAKVESFDISSVIFKFLDILRPGNSRVILFGWNKLLTTGYEAEYVFSMVTRQIRLLIQAKSGASYLKLSAYPKKLISSQANYFTLNQLLDLHHQLYEIDRRIKTGLSPLPLDQLMLQFFYLL